MYGFSHGPYLTGMTVNETWVNCWAPFLRGGTVAYATDTHYRETGGYDQQVTDDAAVALHMSASPVLSRIPVTIIHSPLAGGKRPVITPSKPFQKKVRSPS